MRRNVECAGNILLHCGFELLQLLPSPVSLLHEARDDATGRVVLVHRVRELLARGVQLLLEVEGLQHQRVPLVLEVLPSEINLH